MLISWMYVAAIGAATVVLFHAVQAYQMHMEYFPMSITQ